MAPADAIALRPVMLRRCARLAAGILIASAIFLASGELIARGLDIVDRLNGYSRLLYTRGPSVELPYLLRPGFEATLFGAPVRINRLGFRGPELEAGPRPGVYRILMLGDSVLFGTLLNESDRLSEAAASALNVGVETYEVVNAGVPGFETVAEARLLARVAPEVKPQAVVVLFSLNDYELPLRMSPVGVLSHGDPRQAPSSLLDRSEFMLLLRWMSAYHAGTLWQQFNQKAEEGVAAAGDSPEMQRAADALDRAVQKRHLAFYHAPEAAQWGRVLGGLRAIRDLAAAQGMQLLVVILPEGYQIGVAEPDLAPQRLLQATCRSEGIACLDLEPAFAAAGGRLFLDVQHPNARGHAIVGQAIARAFGPKGHAERALQQ